MTPLEFTVSNPAFGLELDAASTLSTLDGVTSTLNIRPQILEHTFGGAGGVTETITIQINGNENFSISAVATTTVDVAGGLLAQAIHQDDKYISTYDAGSKKLTISSAFDGVAFTTAVTTGTSNISISSADLIQTSAVFVISGTPSLTINNPKTFTYILNPVGPSCMAGANPHSGTITVNPISFGNHVVGSGAEDQIACDGEPITDIIYDLVGASIAHKSGTTPAWLNGTVAGGQLTISGSPNLNILVEQSYPYSFSLGGNFFGCGVASATVSGKITLRPKDHLTLISDPQTINQDICIDDEIIDIVYEFSGSANAMAFNQPFGLPDGVEGQYTPRQQVSEITIGNGLTGATTETYTVYIGSTPYAMRPQLDQLPTQ